MRHEAELIIKKIEKMKNYKNICEKKGYTPYDYQEQFVDNADFYQPTKPILLAVGTGGGKTTLAIMKSDIYYTNPANKGKKTVIFAHGTNVIRSNFEKGLKKYGEVSFKHCVITDSNQIEEAFNSDCEVIVMLPQTIKNHLDKVCKIDWLVVDEAHEWYGQEMYVKIMNVLRPKYQLLLTGTPSKFNGKSEEFYYNHVSVDTLRKAGKLGNVTVHIVSSNYIQNDSQDVHSEGTIHNRVISSTKTDSSLYRVVKSMLKTISKSDIVKGKNIIDTLFNSLDKTIIFCRNQKQAKRFYNILNKELKGKVLKSLSDDGGNSEEFEMFEKNDDIKVLILVRKGRLGFDMPNLYNIVDFTLTQSVNSISQMIGRILRPDGNDSMKYYYKVATANTIWHYQAIMTVVLRLTMQDAYEIYNGNQNEVVIPRPERPEQPVNDEVEVDADDLDFIDTDDNDPKQPTTPHFKDIDPDLIMDLDFFKNYSERSNQPVGEFDIRSSCTLDDVRKECLGLRDRRVGEKAITFEECVDLSKERGYTKKIEFQYGSPAHYAFIQTNGLMDEFVKAAGLKGRKLVLTFEEVKECADQCSSRLEFARKYQSKYKKAKTMGWLSEWFPEIQKSGPKEGSKNFKLNK